MSPSASLQPSESLHAYHVLCDGMFTWNSKMTRSSSPFATLIFRRPGDNGEITLGNWSHNVVRDSDSGIWSVLPAGVEHASKNFKPIARVRRTGIATGADRRTRSVLFSVDGVAFVGAKPQFLKGAYFIAKAVRSDRLKVPEAGEQVGFIKCTKQLGRKEFRAVFHKDVPDILPALSVWIACLLDRRTGEGGEGE